MEYILLYETQPTRSDIFSIFSVRFVRPFKQSINSTVTKLAGSVTKNVTKLSFASVRMCDYKRLSAHNFVNVCLQTTPTTNRRSPSPSRCRLSNLTRQTLRRRDVVQSPFTVVEVDLSRRRAVDHPCCRMSHGSICSLSLTGTIF